MKIPISKPLFDSADFQAIVKPLREGWVAQGPFVRQFEEYFSAYTGALHSTAVSSCTTALHVALAALGIGNEDEVIVPAFTWIATANAVEYLGAKPIFCDIDLQTYNIDVKQIGLKVTSKTKAIIPVHLFGLAAEMDEIIEIAQRYQLFIVEDAACALGAYYKGKHVGTFGDIGCFSFHPRKAVTTGEGGMLTTGNEETDGLLKALRNHGASSSNSIYQDSKAGLLPSEYKHLGYNYRMTDMQGALGLSQMQKAKWIQEQRAIKAERYNSLLKDISWLQPPEFPPFSVHSYQSYVCLFRPQTINLESISTLNEMRNRLMAQLEERGISTRQGTHAVTLQQYYQTKYSIRNEDYPNAFIADNLTIALPLYPQISEEEQEYVVETLNTEYKNGR